MHEKVLDIETADGQMETFLCWPERNGPHPAVLMLMDAPGIRAMSCMIWQGVWQPLDFL